MAAPSSAGGSGGGGSGDHHALLAGARWDETSYPLKEVAVKYTMPNIVRVTKGQYRNIGVAKSVANELYLHSVKSSKKVLAEGIKVKEGKRIHTVEQKFSLPVTYQGWFELLSEDGKAIKPVQSVQELARVFPQRCLVRESMKVNQGGRDSSDVCTDRTRMLSTGEQLSLVGDVLVPNPPGAKGPTRRKMLKCLDQHGESVFMGLDQKGMFSPIAGQGNISGVHNIKALLEKFRLPIMVRLVHGIIPSRLDKSSFTGVFRMLSVYSDETAFVCPMRKDAKMVPISTREPLKLAALQNFPEIQDHEDVRYYQVRCGKMIASYHNSIHVLVNPPDPTRMAGRGWSDQEVFHRQGHGEQASPSSPGHHPPPSQAPGSKVTGTPRLITKANGVTEEDILFDEIDDIYQFVRDGGRPPPPRPRPPHLRKSDPSPMTVSNGMSSSDQRPLSQGNIKSRTRSGSKGELGVRGSSTDQRPGVATAIISKTGSVDILNSSASASPEDTSPATTLSYHKQEKDEHYWEEPIYEEISKYKKAAAAAAAAAGKKDPGKTASMLADPGASPSSSSPARGEGTREPVENLRQMYKLQTTTVTTCGSRISFGGETGDEISGDEDVDRKFPPGAPVALTGGRYDPQYQNMGPYSTPASPASPGTSGGVTPERRSSHGDHPKGYINKRPDLPGMYHGGPPTAGSTPTSSQEFTSVHDRIASINRANMLSSAPLGGAAVASGGAPEVGPTGRRYVRATAHGHAGRSHGGGGGGGGGGGSGGLGSQFVAVARVAPGSTRSSGHASQKSHQAQQQGASGCSANQQDAATASRERHAGRGPRTAYTRVENLRRKLQGLYL